MPNWCSNRLTVTGDAPDVAAVIGAVTNDAGALWFSSLLPMPDTDGTDFDWHSWAVDHWGTKWDLVAAAEETSDEQEMQRGEGWVCWQFETAWSPPIPFVLAVSQRFPGVQVRVEFDEPGNGFAGRYVAQGGACVEDLSFEGPSLSWRTCAVPSCEETVEGIYPWNPEFGPDGKVEPVFCDEHALEREVHRQAVEDQRAT